MLKIGLIGLGNMGRLHLKNLILLQKSGVCKLTCVCDIRNERVEEISIRYKVPGYNCVDTLLEKESIDAAIIATTTSSHFMLAKQLIKNKIPVLVEKPVCTNSEEAAELKKLSESEGVLLAAGFTEVYNSVVAGVKQMLSQNNNINYVDFFRIGQKSSRNDTKDIDVVHDLMIHDIAVLCHLIDTDCIVNISGCLSCYNELSGQYDTSCVNVQTDSGIIIRFMCDRNGTIKIRKFTITMNDMFGEFDYMDQSANISKKGKLDAFGDNVWYAQSCDAVKVRYSNNPLSDEITDFINSVIDKKSTLVSDDWYKITLMTEKIRNALYKSVSNE
jgi:predicted dehydrogenase